jgi:hypothetical protein
MGIGFSWSGLLSICDGLRVEALALERAVIQTDPNFGVFAINLQ